MTRILIAAALCAALFLTGATAQKGPLCPPDQMQGDYRSFVVPDDGSVEALAAIHGGGPTYEYISGPTPIEGTGCVAVYYRLGES